MADHRLNNNRNSIPHSVWPAEWVRKAEQEAANSLGITLYELMLRAGEAAFRLARATWPDARSWLVLCGYGNNGGDGYVTARLAKADGIDVTLIALESDKPFPEEAACARDAWLNAGGEIYVPDAPWPQGVSLIIDGLLGTGLASAPRPAVSALIDKANAESAPVLALDIPSGLLADTGATPGSVIVAQQTLTFIALKPGLLTGKARDVVGELHVDALGLEGWLADKPAAFHRYDATMLGRWLKPRRATAHKGDNGRLLVIGGDRGTAGAICLAGEAALRSGAGLVRVLTRQENIASLLTARPELMAQALTDESLAEGLEWADAVVIGPGLGQEKWGRRALQKVENSQKPMLWDADALNLLAFNPDKRQNRVMTPHPGEAARLLNCDVKQIESDRLLAVRRLAKRYGGVVVLKGAGTLVASDKGETGIVDAGNPGMATGGMGDVLSGIIGALLGQKLSLYDAACAGCVAHAAAADVVARRFGARGMLASDLFTTLHWVVNPEMNNVNHD